MSEASAQRLRALPAARWFDPALALSLATICLVELLVRPGMTGSSLAPPVVILLCLPVAVRRGHPVAAVCAEGALVLASPDFAGDFPAATGLVVAVLSYSCGAHAALGTGVLGVGALFVALEVAIGVPEGYPVPFALATWGPLWVGRQVGLRRQLVSALAESARELDSERDAFARLSVRRERARIARELHDIVAHHLAVIVVQAGAGRLAAPGRSDRAAERFAAIRQSGAHALAEMARLVDLLHADDGDGEEGRGKLRLLLDETGAGGLDVRVTPLPSAVQLPAEVEDSAYRVVQEGLTNAIKHAPGAEVHVRLAVHGDDLEIEVRDGGAATASALAATGSGLGLTGMRERIESIGGTLDAGPQAGGGWCLHARLPVAGRPVIPAR